MAEEKVDLEPLLSRAKELEEEYDWSEAAEAYSRAASIIPAKDPLRLGNVAESGAFALYRYAFQAETREEFRERIAEAIEQYGNAKEAYSKLDSNVSTPWSRRCDAMSAFLRSWSAEVPTEKKRLIGESWGLAKGAMDEFEVARDYPQLRRTNNLLTFAVSIGYAYSADSKSRESLIREGLEYSEKALKLPSEGDDKRDIAMAFENASYYTTLFCNDFLDIDHRGEWDKKSGTLWRKGFKLSEEGGLDALTSTCKFGPLPSTLTVEETLELRRKAFEYAKKTKDILRMAAMFEWMENSAFLEAHEIADPDLRDSFADEALSCAEKARRCYSIASSTYLTEGVFWSGSPKSGFYALKASLEADLGKKREFALRGVEAFEEGLRTAKECDYPEGFAAVLGDASDILFNLARTEANPEDKRRVLERALDHGRQLLDVWKALHPFDYGVMQGKASLADIEHELAEVATDAKERIGLCREAISLMKEAYEGLRKEARFGSATIERWSKLKLGEHQYKIADWSLQLYGITKDRIDLVNAAEAFKMAVELYLIAGNPSRAAESCWKAGQTQDALGDYLGASERFAKASSSYKQAAENLPRLSNLYRDYDLYMQAWSQIELAKHHHVRQESRVASECYGKASDLLELTERWRLLSPNYKAWAEVENGEDLSRGEKSKEAVAAFGNAAKLFAKARQSLGRQRESGHDLDETENTMRYIRVADLRMEYCEGRLALEEARDLDKQGDDLGSCERYGRAADTFERLCAELESDQERREMQLIMTLSRAWQMMAKAETEASPQIYELAAQTFEQAKDLSTGEKAKLQAIGHSRFCKALAAGTEFADTGDHSLHAAATRNLESAAKYYLKAGLEKDSEYAKASRRLFDAYVYMDRASREEDQAKKAKLYAMTEKVLENSAASYSKADHPKKKDLVLKLLREVKSERELAVALMEVLHAPDDIASTAGLPNPSPTHETAVGMERFEHADVQATLFARPRNLHLGQDLSIDIELVNAGNGAAQLTKVDGIIPDGFDVVTEPERYRVENSCLNLRGRRLDSLKTEDVNVVLKPNRKGCFTLTPRILYLDDNGKYKFQEPEPIRITVGVETTELQDMGISLDTREATEARSLLAGLNVVTLSHYRIVGNYVRYGKTVCNDLKDARQKIVAACSGSSPKRENYIIWAPPGSGKTYFIQEVAALLGDSVHYSEINIAKLDEAGFRSALAELRTANKPCLCLVDEMDAKPDESWLYESLLPFMDASVTEGARFVFVLAGSSGSSLDEMKRVVASRPKGSDVLSRVPTGNEYSIPPMGVGDRLLVVLSQFRQAGRQMGHEVREVEKLGLYYVAVNPRLSNARQLREFAVRCAERVLPGDDRLKYDSLFHPGDRENKLFWTHATQSAGNLADSFLLVED